MGGILAFLFSFIFVLLISLLASFPALWAVNNIFNLELNYTFNNLLSMAIIMIIFTDNAKAEARK